MRIQMAVVSVTAHGEGSSPSPTYVSRIVEEGFTLMSADEQWWYDAVRGRLNLNFNFDEFFLGEIGLSSDICRMLSNLCWIGFHEAVIGYNLDIAIVVASTMQLGSGEHGSDAVTFHVCDEEHMITVDGLTPLLGFNLDADVVTHVSKEELNSFWLCLSPIEERKRGNFRNPAIQQFHQWLAVRTMGKIDSGNSPTRTCGGYTTQS